MKLIYYISQQTAKRHKKQYQFLQIICEVIQPMVENAVRHGITKKLEGGTIRITTDETEEVYRITIPKEQTDEPDSS